MAIYILTDSTADIRPEEGGPRGIRVVPLKVQFGDTTYLDGMSLDHDTFYKMLVEADQLPTTSQAAPDDFLTYFEQAKARGDTLICLLLAGTLSGTCQSAVIAKELCGYENIYVIDSTQTVLGLRALIDLACQLRDQGVEAAKIVEELERAKGKVKLLAIVDTLEYLHKGGRLPAAVSVVGGLLKVKPVITLQNGSIKLVGKGIGTKGSLSALIELIGGQLDADPRLPIYYGYTGTDSLCRALMELTEKTFGLHRHEVHSVGAVIGTHVGPGAAVIVYLEK